MFQMDTMTLTAPVNTMTSTRKGTRSSQVHETFASSARTMSSSPTSTADCTPMARQEPRTAE